MSVDAPLCTENSTNVRDVTPAIPWWFGSGVRALATVAPDAALEVAADAFFRTRRGKRWAPPEAGHPFELATRHGAVAGWFWDPPAARGPAVYLVHGWNGAGAQLGALVPALTGLGLRVVAWDAPGHGASAGDRASIPVFADVLEEVAGLFGPALGVVAHSLGAAAAVHAVSRGQVATRRLALVAPAAEPGAWVRGYARQVASSEALEARLLAHIERRVGRRLGEVDLPSQIALWSEGPEVLVVHDEADREVPVEEGERVAEAAGGRLVRTRGLGHRRILSDPGVVELVAGFVGGRKGTVGCAHRGPGGGPCPDCAMDRWLYERAGR